MGDPGAWEPEMLSGTGLGKHFLYKFTYQGFCARAFPANLFFLGKLEDALRDIEFPPGNGKGFAFFANGRCFTDSKSENSCA